MSITMDDGLELNTSDSWKLWSYLAKTGKKYNNMWIPGPLLRHDRMLKSSLEN